MTIQYINTGSSANAGDGDSLRSAFVKVNNNFTYLSTASFNGATGNGYTGSQGDIGYTGSQGNIGYTGSAGTSPVFISTSTGTGALAYYLNSSTITEIPRINFQLGVLSIGNGSTGTVNSLYIENTISSELFGRGFTYANHINTSEGNNFTFYRSRGTPAEPTATVSGDEIVDIAFLGHNGTIPTYGASITAVVDQVPVNGQVPIRLVFAGNNNAGQIQTHMAITSTGTIRMNNLGALGTGTQISVSASLIPKYDVTYDLGSTSSQWRSLYVGTSTIYLGGTALSITPTGSLTINGNQIGNELVSVTVPTVGGTTSADETGITYLNKIAIFTEGAFAVGTWTDVQIGWTVTDNNGFTDTIASRGGFGAASFVTTVNDWPAPASGKTYVFTSPDYQLGYTDPIEISVGDNNWTFDSYGGLTFPDGNTITIAGNDFKIQPGSGNLLKLGDPINFWTFNHNDGTLTAPGAIQWDLNSNSPGFTDISINKVGDNLAISTDVILGPSTWIFTKTGNLNLPGGAVIDTYGDGASTETVFWGAPGKTIAVRSMIDENSYGGGIDIRTNGQTAIFAQGEGGSAGWAFNEDGNLTLPGEITSLSNNFNDGFNLNVVASNNQGTVTLNFNRNGTLTLPGAIVNSVISKIGGAQLGVATAITITNSPNANWTVGTGVFANGINFAVAVDGSGNATVTSISDGGSGHYVGETFGPVPGTSFGGTSPADDMYFEVTAIALPTRTSLDLNKTVNILSSGLYSLADGTEGQIMHFVPVSGITSGAYIQIANARVLDTGTGLPIEEIDYSWEVFGTIAGGPYTVSMAIFADGAWCLRGGVND